jgi:hypothetical protein
MSAARPQPDTSPKAVLASFTEWFGKTYPAEYSQWKDACQKETQTCVSLFPQDIPAFKCLATGKLIAVLVGLFTTTS